MIEDKYGLIPPLLMVLEHHHEAIVQHKPISVKPGCEDGVIRSPDAVAQDDDPEVRSGNAGFLQSNILCEAGNQIFVFDGLSIGRPEAARSRQFCRPFGETSNFQLVLGAAAAHSNLALCNETS
jgi:hypothetical protein